MTSTKKSRSFDSEEGAIIESTLKQIVLDSAYNTESSYSANSEKYPNHLIPFVDKHMNYLKSHPSIDPQQYISNLRLMTRIR